MKYEYQLKKVSKKEPKEIKKKIYKNPLSIFTAILTAIIVLYVIVNLPKQQSIKAIKTTIDNTENW